MTGNSIDLQTAAAHLGVHYQTAYQWVRSGRLPADRIQGRYRLDPDDVARFAKRRARPAPRRSRRPRQGFGDLARRALGQLSVGDERQLRLLVQRLVDDGVTMTTIIQEVLAPSLRQIGQEWHAGRSSISIEHRATAIVERVLAEHHPTPRGRRRGTAVVAALSGDRHTLPTSMAALALRDDNWTVEHLGADLPPDELFRFADEHHPDLVVITVTNSDVAALAHGTARRLESRGTRVLVGQPGDTLDQLQRTARS